MKKMNMPRQPMLEPTKKSPDEIAKILMRPTKKK